MAKLTIKENNSPDKENPQTEPKILQWSTENNIRENISVRVGFSVLNVVFSFDKPQGNKLAFVGTRMSLDDLPRLEDAFSVGTYVFEIAVTASDGTLVVANFGLNVTPEWRDLAMEKIEQP